MNGVASGALLGRGTNRECRNADLFVSTESGAIVSRRSQVKIGARDHLSIVNGAVSSVFSHCILSTPPEPEDDFSADQVSCSTGELSVRFVILIRPRSSSSPGYRVWKASASLLTISMASFWLGIIHSEYEPAGTSRLLNFSSR